MILSPVSYETCDYRNDVFVCVCVCVRVADLKQMHLLNVVAAAPPQRPERPGNMLTRMF